MSASARVTKIAKKKTNRRAKLSLVTLYFLFYLCMANDMMKRIATAELHEFHWTNSITIMNFAMYFAITTVEIEYDKNVIYIKLII